MAGPDPKRMYLAINAQNIQSLKAEKPYWSKPFVFITPAGTGPKYTALQAAMLLHKMKVVDYLFDQPALDVTVKSTDGKNTLIVAVEAKMDVELLEKLLRKLELKCLAEVDGSGKGALDYAESGSAVYEFLHSMGCKTRQEREAAVAGFFGESVKGTVPGVSEHQRRRKQGGGSRRKEKKKQDASGSLSSREGGGKSESPAGEEAGAETPAAEEEEQESTWREFDNIEELETALHAYIDEWGEDHEEGKTCVDWLEKIEKAKQTGKTEKVLKKWNATIAAMKAEAQPEEEGQATNNSEPDGQRGRTRNRSPSADNNKEAEQQRPAAAVDREAVKLFFAGTAEEQVNLKNKGANSHRLTFVVSPRSASVGAGEENSSKSKKNRNSNSSRRSSSGGSPRGQDRSPRDS